MPDTQAQRFHEDVIELKDGSVIHGWIVEQKPGEYVKIELLGGSILVYQQEEIEKISREYSRYKSIRRQLNHHRQPIYYRETGFYSIVSTSFMFNENRWNGLRIDMGIQVRTGYRFNRHFGAGVGTGIEFYEAGIIIPFFVEANGDLMKKRITPHYQAQIGFGHGAGTTWFAEEFRGGPMGQAGLGIKMRSRKKLEMLYMLVFKMQETSDVRRPWGGWDPWGNPVEPTTITRNRVYQSLAFQVGLVF